MTVDEVRDAWREADKATADGDYEHAAVLREQLFVDVLGVIAGGVPNAAELARVAVDPNGHLARPWGGAR